MLVVLHNNIENCTNYGVITTTYDNGTAYQISNGNNANCKELGKAVATH